MTVLALLGLSAALAAASDFGAKIETGLADLRIERRDLGIRPERWPTPSPTSIVEEMLTDPITTPGRLEQWSEQLGPGAAVSSSLVLLAAQAMDIRISTAAALVAREKVSRHFSPELSAVIDSLAAALAQAQPLVERSVASLTPPQRRLVLAHVRPLLVNDAGRPLEPEAFRLMGRFELRPMLDAAAVLAAACDKAAASLAALSQAPFQRARFSTPSGDILVSSSGDDDYSPQEIEKAAVIVDLGGRNRYSGAAAGAGEGRIRIVIDLGNDVRIDGGKEPAGGAGVFGIGLLYLPSPGHKSVEAGNISLGAGLFGAGGAFIGGSKISASGFGFTQGAGAFGIGLWQSEAPEARMSARFGGQGFGFTRGFGLFRHLGGGADVEGGLYFPDFREPGKAQISMVQGVGYGPRALSAGGIGLASLEGDGNRLRASYFAQGSGYWHGFGGLIIRGSGNRLQSRRYSQGAGVHSAVGALLLRGDDNTLINWGVGPAYGWDLGIGFLDSNGDGNSFQADWGTGRGDANGRAFAWIRGRKNRIALPDFGTGSLSRGAPSYGLAWIEGFGHKVQMGLDFKGPSALRLMKSPWGLLKGEFQVVASLGLARPEWPGSDPALGQGEDLAAAQAAWKESEALDAAGRLSRRLWLAASAKTGSPYYTQSIESILAVPREDLPALVSLISTERFDELGWIRAALAAQPTAAAPIKGEIKKTAGLRKALILGSLRSASAAEALSELEAASKDSDWRVRREVALSLGALLSREEGEDPGRLTMIERGLRGWTEDELTTLGQKRIAELFAVLALNPDLAAAARLELFSRLPNPYDTARPEAAMTFRDIIERGRPAYARAFERELSGCATREPGSRAVLLELLSDPDADVAQAAILALGQLGREEDAARLAGFLDSARAPWREAAAVALARMGPTAREAIEKAQQSSSPRTRSLAALAAARSWDKDTLSLLAKGFDDPDRSVRETAVSAVSLVQGPLHPRRKQFVKALRWLGERDADAGIRLLAAQTYPGLPE